MLFDPIRSVLNFSFYREVPRKSFAATFGYISYLGLVYALALVVSLYIHLRPKIQETVDWLSASVPKLTLADGKLSSSAPGETVIRHPTTTELVLVIDTERSTAVTPAEMKEKGALGYLTRDTVFMFNSLSGEMKAYDLSKAENKEPVSIDGAFYAMMGKVLNTLLYPIAFVATWFVFILWKHLSALVYSLVALLINAFLSAGLDFPALYKMSVYAQTPVVIIQIIATMLLRDIPLFRLLAFIVVGVYLWQGLRQQEAPPPDPLGA